LKPFRVFFFFFCSIINSHETLNRAAIFLCLLEGFSWYSPLLGEAIVGEVTNMADKHTKADLHVHLQMDPLALLKLAQERDVSVLGVGNHDNVEGLAELVETAAQHSELGVQVIPGVELSAYGDRRTQFRAFGVPYDNADFRQELSLEFGQSRSDRTLTMAFNFNKLGLDMTFDPVDFRNQFDVSERASLAEYLLQHFPEHPAVRAITDGKGGKDAMYAVLDAYFNPKSPERQNCYEGYQGHFPTPEKTLEFCKQWGLVTFFSSPAQEFSLDQIRELVPKFKAIHMQGIEPFHIDHSEAETKALLSLAMEHNLMSGGGSDFRTPAYEKKGMVLGRFEIPASVGESILYVQQQLKP